MFLREALTILLVLFSVVALGETRKKVAIVDSGISDHAYFKKYLCRSGHKDFTGTNILDAQGHGTNVAGLIVKKLNPVTHCLVIIKFFHTYKHPMGSLVGVDNTLAIARYLAYIKPHYINMSLEGSIFMTEEYNILYSLLERGTKIVVAAGNRAANLDEGCYSYPACYFFHTKNFYVVGANNSNSNTNGPVNRIRPGVNQCARGICLSGTSQATANFMADLVSGVDK